MTKKTIYDRFGSKDALIVAYLRARDERWRAHVEERIGREPAASPERLLATFEALDTWLHYHSPRGCAFVNAAAELAEPDHPARAVAVEEKRWLQTTFARLATKAGLPHPDRLAAKLLILHEGAIVAHSILGDGAAAVTAREAAAELVHAAR